KTHKIIAATVTRIVTTSIGVKPASYRFFTNELIVPQRNAPTNTNNVPRPILLLLHYILKGIFLLEAVPFFREKKECHRMNAIYFALLYYSYHFFDSSVGHPIQLLG